MLEALWTLLSMFAAAEENNFKNKFHHIYSFSMVQCGGLLAPPLQFTIP